jgi:hypothetical protein
MKGWIVGGIPWSQGKMQGISTIQPFFPKMRLENNCYFGSLGENSLRREQGIYSRVQGII